MRLKISVLAILSVVIGLVVAIMAPATHKAAMGLLGGVGTYVLGLKGSLFLLGSVKSDSDIVRQLAAFGVLDIQGGVKPAVQTKTANYQIVAPVNTAGVITGDQSGTIFNNRGAVGAVTWTLPAITQALAGCVYEFYGVVAAQNTAVAAAAGTICTFNNAAATSVTCSTAGGLIGAHMRAVCDGTRWLVTGDQVGVTYTVA